MPSDRYVSRIHKFPSFFCRVDQGNIAVVFLRLLIQQTEDTFRSRKGHNDGVQLLADLVDRHVEALLKVRKLASPPSVRPEIPLSASTPPTMAQST